MRRNMSGWWAKNEINLNNESILELAEMFSSIKQSCLFYSKIGYRHMDNNYIPDKEGKLFNGIILIVSELIKRDKNFVFDDIEEITQRDIDGFNAEPKEFFDNEEDFDDKHRTTAEVEGRIMEGEENE